MRISGTEPSSVILSQNMKFKNMNSDDPKVPNQAEPSSVGLAKTWNLKIWIVTTQKCLTKLKPKGMV